MRNSDGHVEVEMSISGEIDIAREGELIEMMISMDPIPGTTVDLDLAEVTFIDSAGLRGILNARTYLEGRGCRLRVVRPGPQARRLIELTSLGEVLGMDAGEPVQLPPG